MTLPGSKHGELLDDADDLFQNDAHDINLTLHDTKWLLDSSSMAIESPSKVPWCHPFLPIDLVNVATGDTCRCNSSTVGLWTSDTWKSDLSRDSELTLVIFRSICRNLTPPHPCLCVHVTLESGLCARVTPACVRG